MTMDSLLLWQHWREQRACRGQRKDGHGQFIAMATLEGAQSMQRAGKNDCGQFVIMITLEGTQSLQRAAQDGHSQFAVIATLEGA